MDANRDNEESCHWAEIAEAGAEEVRQQGEAPDALALKKLTKRGRKSKKYLSNKSASTADAARAALLSMKTEFSGPFSKIDLDQFTSTFFPHKRPLPYSRLHPLLKLECCQWVLHNHPDEAVRPYPAVFLLSPELQALDDAYLRKKIQRKLKEALGATPLYWMTTEYKNSAEKQLKHLNFEILLYPGEQDKVKLALERLSGLYAIDPATNKPILNADGTKKKRAGLTHAVNFPTDSRAKEARLRGEFYAVYNWPSYAAKQFKARQRARDHSKRLLTANTEHSAKQGEPLYYVSAELNRLAAEFYAANIYGKPTAVSHR
jgi:hypothetical protein